MNTLLGIYGAGGFGREVMPLARSKGTDCVFIDDDPIASELNDHPVMRWSQFLEIETPKKMISIAIANSKIREVIASKCRNANIRLFPVQADNVILLDNVQIGEGSILCPFFMATSNVKIGKYFHGYMYSYVAHDCVIGDYVTFAPAVKCNGNIIIEDHAYIGTGAILKQGTPQNPLVIGRGAVVGMGAVVTKSVAPGTVVVGNPARSLAKG